MDIVRFDPLLHQHHWEDFIVATYRNPNYVMLSPVFLRWQFLDNPANLTGGYTLWLITRREQIVAQLGFVPFLGTLPKGESFYGAYPINLMVRPDYRAAGLGALLLQRLLREFPCLVNPGVNEAGAVLGKGLGMTDLGFLRRYIAIIDKRAARVLALDGRLPEGIREANPSEEAEAGVRHVKEMPPEAPAQFPFPQPAYGAVRTRDYLCWRYEQHPAFTYEFLFSSDFEAFLFSTRRERRTAVLRFFAWSTFWRDRSISFPFFVMLFISRRCAKRLSSTSSAVLAATLPRSRVPVFSTRPSTATAASQRCFNLSTSARQAFLFSPLPELGQWRIERLVHHQGGFRSGPTQRQERDRAVRSRRNTEIGTRRRSALHSPQELLPFATAEEPYGDRYWLRVAIFAKQVAFSGEASAQAWELQNCGAGKSRLRV